MSEEGVSPKGRLEWVSAVGAYGRPVFDLRDRGPGRTTGVKWAVFWAETREYKYALAVNGRVYECVLPPEITETSDALNYIRALVRLA